MRRKKDYIFPRVIKANLWLHRMLIIHIVCNIYQVYVIVVVILLKINRLLCRCSGTTILNARVARSDVQDRGIWHLLLGRVVQKLMMRKGKMISYNADNAGEGWVKAVMDVLARGLIGYMAGEFKNDVHGQGTINHIFKGYEPYKGAIDTGRNGTLISMVLGESAGYTMSPAGRSSSTCKCKSPFALYPRMVVGQSSKSQDIYINPCIKKQLTNICAAGADEKIVLASPRVMTLEEALAYMGNDELIEIMPSSVRLRKAELDANRRMRSKGKK